MKPLILIFLCLPFFVIGQKKEESLLKNQINVNAGIQTVNLNYRQPFLSANFERQFKGKWSFNVGGTFNSFRGDDLITDSLVYNTDSLRIYRNQTGYNKTLSLQAGIQYRFNDYLKIGVNLILGFNRSHQGFRDRSESYNSFYGIWGENNYPLYDFFSDIYDQRQVDVSTGHFSPRIKYLGYTNYQVTGASLNVTGCLPIGEKWELALTATTLFSRYTYLNNNTLTKDLNTEGLNSFPNFENYITETPSFNLWNNVLTLGVGYKF